MTAQFTLRPYPNPEYLPVGAEVWLWQLRDGDTLLGSGAVQSDNGGPFTVYGSHIAPAHRGQGWYRAVILPALAAKFGAVWSGPCNAPAAYHAWERAGARRIGERWCLSAAAAAGVTHPGG